MLKPTGALLSLLYCLSVLVLSACRPLTAEPAVPAVVTFETPLEEMRGGAHLAPPVASWDGYGEAVDVRGDVLAIGASEWNFCGPGSVYIYRRSGEEWRQEQQLHASDGEAFMQQARRFGSSVALGDGIIAVGAPGTSYPGAGSHTGAVYIFEYDGETWQQTAKLAAERLEQNVDRAHGDPSMCSRVKPRAFGGLVALHGDMLIVSEDWTMNSIYVFQRIGNDWREQARIPLPSLPERNLYITSLALADATLAVSAFYVQDEAEEAAVLAGNVIIYVFERNDDDWTENLRFKPEGDANLLFFREVNIGASVALTDDADQASLLAVGLPGLPDWSNVQEHIGMFGVNPGPDASKLPESNRQTGAVYLFERTEHGGWQAHTTLKPAGWQAAPGPGVLFSGVPVDPKGEQGHSAVDGYLASMTFSGTFVFPGDIYSENPEITFFGATVDLDDNRLAVTAGFANATYLFERRDQDWVYWFSFIPGQQSVVWEDYAQVVRISDDTLLLGTPGEFGNSAYVFTLLRVTN